MPMYSTDARVVVLSGRPQINVTVDTVFVIATDSVTLHASDSVVIRHADSIGKFSLFDKFSDRNTSVAEPAEAPVLTNQTPVTTVIQTITSSWQVHFNQKNGGTADEEFTELESWTRKENPTVKYFSGTAVYKTTVAIDSTQLASNKRIFMDLGTVKNIADISINGVSAGVLWKAPFRTADIKPLLKDGDNLLEIKVTNVWRNRMIGDVQPGEKHPVTAIRRFYKSTDKPLPSGLLGPVRLIGEL